MPRVDPSIRVFSLMTPHRFCNTEPSLTVSRVTESGKMTSSEDSFSLAAAGRPLLTVSYALTLFAMVIQLPFRISEGPDWLTAIMIAVACVSVAAISMLWVVRTSFDPSGVTYRGGWFQRRHIVWSDVTRMSSDGFRPKALEVRAADGAKASSARPSAEQLDRLHQWRARAQSEEITK